MLVYYFKYYQGHNNIHILYELRVNSVVLFEKVYRCKQNNNNIPDKVCVIFLIF